MSIKEFFLGKPKEKEDLASFFKNAGPEVLKKAKETADEALVARAALAEAMSGESGEYVPFKDDLMLQGVEWQLDTTTWPKETRLVVRKSDPRLYRTETVSFSLKELDDLLAWYKTFRGEK